MPLISVIIPVFNGETTIQETIESVLNQSIQDLEVIVIDDGSQDLTRSIIERIGDRRVKLFSYPNGGVSVSRDRGISHASGEYIAFLDADDLWTSDKLEAQLSALQSNPQAAVAYSWVDYITPEGDFFRPGNHISASGNIYERMLHENVLENGSNPLIRKYALDEVGGFKQHISLVADWDMWLRLAARYEFAVVPRPQILYRMSSRSVSSNVLKMEQEGMTFLHEAFQQAPPNLQPLKQKSIATFYHYLTFKALEVANQKSDGLTAARFFWQAIINDLSVLWQWQTLLKAFFKITVVLALPPQQAWSIRNKTKQLLVDLRLLSVGEENYG